MKKNPNYLRKVLTMVVAVLGLAVFAEEEDVGRLFVTENRIEAPATGLLETGVWYHGLERVRAYAERTGIPLVAVWSNKDCQYCEKLENNFMSAAFKDWMKDSGYLFCFTWSEDPDGIAKGDVYRWCQNGLAEFPYVRFYWKDRDQVRVDVSQSGNTVDGKIGSSLHPTDPSYDAAAVERGGKATASYIAARFADYEIPSLGGSFADDQGYEAEPSTTTLYVKAVRRRLEPFEQNLLLVRGAETNAVPVSWAEEQTEQMLEIDLDGMYAEGAVTTLAWVGENDEPGATSTLTFRSPSNSCSNPYWIGERTAETLQAGDWTMDLDAALARTAAQEGDAFTAVLVTGALWCPWCRGMEHYVFENELFPAFAETNNIVFAVLDNPKRFSAADKYGEGDVEKSVSAGPYGAGPTLLRRTPGTVSGVPGTFSGAGYLSRKMIAEEDAEAVLQRNHDICYFGGTYAAPESYRTGYPTLILLNKAGMIVGRLAYATTGVRDELNRYVFDPAENMLRLERLVAEALSGHEENRYGATTGLALTAEGSLSVDLTVNAPVQVFRLTDVPVGVLTVSAATEDTNTVVTLTLQRMDPVTVSRKDASLQTVGEATGVMPVVLSSGAGSVSYEFAKRPEDGNCVLKVETAVLSGEAHTLSVDLTSSVELKTGTVRFQGKPEISVQESDGVVAIRMAREGGASGVAAVTVNVEGADPDSDRYYIQEWRTFTWNEGESGLKAFFIALNELPEFREDETLSFTLEAAEGNQASVSTDPVVVTITGESRPYFGSLEEDVSLNLNFAASTTFPVRNLSGGSVTLQKVGGSLPPGVTVKFDKVTGAVIFSGTPTKPGTYTVSYLVKERNGTVTEAGPATTFTLTVRDPAEGNAFVGLARNQTIPLFAEETDGTLLPAGTLTTSVTTRNKISAKYAGTEPASVSFSGAWQTMDWETGTASADLVVKSGAALRLTLDADGRLSATVTGVANEFLTREGQTLAGSADAPVESDYPAYAGYYTVTLPVDEADTNGVCRGTGYLALNFTAAPDIKKGVVKYAGTLSNGTTVSGSAKLMPRADTPNKSFLTIFNRLSKDVLGVSVAVCANARDLCSDVEQLQVVNCVASRQCYQLHRETDVRYLVRTKAYGGFYTKNLSPQQICDMFPDDYFTRMFEMFLDAEGLDESEYYGGPIESVPSAIAEATDLKFVLSDVQGGKFTLSFAKGTGCISGSATLTIGQRQVDATWKGVLLPGWTVCGDCGEGGEELTERPFGSGTVFFTDKVGTRTIKRSLPIDMEVYY